MPKIEWYSSRLSLAGLLQKERNDHFYDIPYNRTGFTVLANMNNTFKLAANLTLNLDYHLQSKFKQGPWDVRPMQYFNASLQLRTLKGKLLVKAYCNDIFRQNATHLTNTWRGQDMELRMRTYRRVGLTLTYNFAGYKERRHQQVDTSRFK